MNYIIIGAVIFIALALYGYIATAKGIKKAPESLKNAKQKLAQGETNDALRELAKSFVIPLNGKITPEYNAHLLQVLEMLKQILSGMNVSNDKIDQIMGPLNITLRYATGTIELEESLYKPVEAFFEKTESDKDMISFLKKVALEGEVNQVDSDDEQGVYESDRAAEFVNTAGKLLLKGKALEAAEIYKQALTQSWNNHDKAFLYEQLAACYVMNKDLENADAHYKKSIFYKSYFQNVWNYCDFLIDNKRKIDADKQMSLLMGLISSESDQADFDELSKKYSRLS